MKRARRDPRVFDEAGAEVFISKMCPHCLRVKPLKAFGLRKMGDGKIRDCPWCRTCRSASGRKEAPQP